MKNNFEEILSAINSLNKLICTIDLAVISVNNRIIQLMKEKNHDLSIYENYSASLINKYCFGKYPIINLRIANFFCNINYNDVIRRMNDNTNQNDLEEIILELFRKEIFGIFNMLD